jgi:hypothetical protein
MDVVEWAKGMGVFVFQVHPSLKEIYCRSVPEQPGGQNDLSSRWQSASAFGDPVAYTLDP